MRSILLLAPTLPCALAALGGSETSMRRNLQSQAVCDELSALVQPNTTAAAIQESSGCNCFNTNGGDVRYACRRDNACLSSDGGDPMRGDFLSTFTKDTEGASFSQTITAETCFQYPDDVNNGTKVCVSSVRDGFGQIATCEINVDGSQCNVCRYCPINLISFDCSNLGYENNLACGDSNAKDSILSFLYEPEFATGCTGSSSAASPTLAPSALMMPFTMSPFTSAPSTSPTGGAFVASTMVATFFGLVPLLLMG